MRKGGTLENYLLGCESGVGVPPYMRGVMILSRDVGGDRRRLLLLILT